jgi:hypothetical protein
MLSPAFVTITGHQSLLIFGGAILRSGRGRFDPGIFPPPGEHHTTRRADAQRGKFRSFLLGALKNYLANEGERAGRKKRGGDCEILSLDDQIAPLPTDLRVQRQSGL